MFQSAITSHTCVAPRLVTAAYGKEYASFLAFVAPWSAVF